MLKCPCTRRFHRSKVMCANTKAFKHLFIMFHPTLTNTNTHTHTPTRTPTQQISFSFYIKLLSETSPILPSRQMVNHSYALSLSLSHLHYYSHIKYLPQLTRYLYPTLGVPHWVGRQRTSHLINYDSKQSCSLTQGRQVANRMSAKKCLDKFC